MLCLSPVQMQPQFDGWRRLDAMPPRTVSLK